MKRIVDNIISFFIPAILLVLLVKVYISWFLSPNIAAGDWPYFSRVMLRDWPTIAPFWSRQGGIGLGGVNPDFPIFSYQYFTVSFVNILHLPWALIYKATWFGLFFVLSFTSSLYLYRTVRHNSAHWEQFLAAFLYLANSYVLMIAGGGQMGIALAYSVTPFVLASFFVAQKSLLSSSLRKSIRLSMLTGFFYSLQIFFEPRTSYITGIIMLLYVIYLLFISGVMNVRKQVMFWTILVLVVFLIHSYWVVPFLLFHLLSVPQGITSSTGFIFFSFADFSHAFSMLQPNWPENIFGKVSFLRPEFLIYPFIAFSGLVFDKGRRNSFYIFFSILVLIFTFLAKGTTEPFGFINMWIFTHIPGMNVFRDPTKFYYFIVLGYIVMIPYSLSIFMKTRVMRAQWRQLLFLIVSLILLAFPIRDAFLAKLTGTFIPANVPHEYVQLENFIASQAQFSRTLWIPDQSRFRFVSETHPIMVAETFFQTASQSAMKDDLVSVSFKEKLQDYAIKYIIIPDDTTGEIFLTDRKYDNKKRQEFLQILDRLPYLKKQTIGNINLYEMPHVNDYLYISDGKVNYRKIGNSQYYLQINTSVPTVLHLGEAYNKNWLVRLQKSTIQSAQTTEGLNSFLLPAGNYQAVLTFFPDELRYYFYAFSLFSFIAVIILLIIL